MFNWKPNLPIDIDMLKESVKDQYNQYYDLEEPYFDKQLKEHMDTLELVADNIKEAQMKYKHQYDRKHDKSGDYHVGQFVLKKRFHM